MFIENRYQDFDGREIIINKCLMQHKKQWLIERTETKIKKIRECQYQAQMRLLIFYFYCNVTSSSFLIVKEVESK